MKKDPYDLSSGDRINDLRAGENWKWELLDKIVRRANNLPSWKRDNVRAWERQARGGVG